MDRMLLDTACRTACRTGRAIWVTKGRSRALAWTPPPRPKGSFGLVGEWVHIGPRAGAGVLIIPFEPKALGWVTRRSLRMFRIEQPKSPFVRVADARLHPDLPAIYAMIDGPGAFGLIGLHGHPLVQDAIEALCRLGRTAAHLPASRLPDLRDRICEVVLCAPEFRTFFTSRDAFTRLAAERHLTVPETMPPPLSRPGSRGETLCDRCHGIDVLDFPDCQARLLQ